MSSPSPCCHWLKRPGCVRAWGTACAGVKGSASPGLIGVRQSGSLTHRKLLGAVRLIGKQRGMTIRSWYHHIQWQRSHSRAAVVISHEHTMLTVYAMIDGHMAFKISPVLEIQSGSKNNTGAKWKKKWLWWVYSNSPIGRIHNMWFKLNCKKNLTLTDVSGISKSNCTSANPSEK